MKHRSPHARMNGLSVFSAMAIPYASEWDDQYSDVLASNSGRWQLQ